MPDSSSPLSRQEIEETLRKVRYPGLSRDIVSFGLVKSIETKGRDVHLVVEGTSRDSSISGKIEEEVRRTLQAVKGIGKVEISMRWSAPEARHGEAEQKPEPLLTTIPAKIAVASGKGGVGKSTVAVYLALALQKAGLKVGLLDLDIYGPSLPTMLGVLEKPRAQDGKIVPLQKFGLELMSIGFFIDHDTPMIWRGPMVHQAAEQFMRDVAWEDLDILVVDLPPGTGDAQMTLSQRVELSGVVIVSTPQDLALIDARKGVRMFQTMHVPVLGVLENMSTFACPHCGTVTPIFGEGGAERAARELGVPFLGRVPILPLLREVGDAGTPWDGWVALPQVREVFQEVARRIMKA
ncbi:MAG: Mrp/NBP35 family ATP-binding protein, partial [Calditrichaeota bacterium]|nr:Mrp/NBP35 family ATP-binding protein [Calditrichota bacterium]